MLARNTFANYVGQGYTSVVAIVVTPLYLTYLGPEEFGLIGFFVLFTTWLQLLTIGLNPTLARQVALYNSRNELASFKFRSILRSIEYLILGLCLVTAFSVWMASGWIAESWLKAESLPIEVITTSIAVMGGIAALRWGVSLYSSGLSGMEQLVWLNGFNIAVATLRYFGGLIIVSVWLSIEIYFKYQIVLGVLELLVVGSVFYLRQPEGSRAADPGLRVSFSSLREVLPFILATGYTAIAWVFVTQFDKLLLSSILPLELFGYFSFAIVLSNGVQRVTDPINKAFLPRLTRLVGAQQHVEVRKLYYFSSQLLAVISFSVAGVIALFPEQTLLLLTAHQELSEYASPFLPWFVLGSAVLAFATNMFMIQVAYGQLSLHVINSTFSALIQVPALAYIAIQFGPLELGVAWLVFRVVILFIMAPIVHRKFGLGNYSRWVRLGLLQPVLGVTVGLAVCWLLDISVIHTNQMTDRSTLLGTLLAFGCFTLSVSILCAEDVRKKIFGPFRHFNRK